MAKKDVQWLPHLDGYIPREAFGYSISMYSIALEAWRRGLQVRFVDVNQTKSHTVFYLSNGKREHRFAVSRGDKVQIEAIKTCINKDLTKKFLLKAGVPAPEGEVFDKDYSKEEIISYANRLGYPLVIKPLDGTGGHGVIANIETEEEFLSALYYVREDLRYEKIIVEKHFKGEDVRIYVLDGKVLAGLKRLPANIVGDGKKTIAELIRDKNKERRKNPALNNTVGIKIDKELKNMLVKQGYTLESVPKRGQQVFLKAKNNITSGGDSIDVTDELSEEIKEIAINGANAIPGLPQCGIDMIINMEENTGTIIEINSRPSIKSHLFPMDGKARDIPKAIVDFYFPESKANQQSFLYFGMKPIFESFQNGQIKEIILPKHPKGELFRTSYLIKREVLKPGYRRWIQKQAKRLKLNGFIKPLSKQEARIVVAGTKESIDSFKSIVEQNSYGNAKLIDIVEQEWAYPIKLGFEVLPMKNLKETKNSTGKSNTKKKIKSSTNSTKGIFRRILNKIN